MVVRITKVAIIEADSNSEFQRKINQFNVEHNVSGIQTHVNLIQGDGMATMIYTAVLSYKELIP